MKICKSQMITVLAAVFFFSSQGAAEELEMINRPVNASGLTGLIVTATPFVQAPGTFEIGAGGSSERSMMLDYTVGRFPLSVNAGIGKNMEMALRAAFVKIVDDAGRSRGIGDAEISFKWNVIPQREYSSRPAASLIASVLAPTDVKDIRITGVAHWGARIGVSIGSDIGWKDHVAGLYADAHMTVQDITDNAHKDIYGAVNAGLLLPISKHRNLQLILEYTSVRGLSYRNMTPETGIDHSAFTPGVRLVSERFNFTIGMQYVNKQVTGYDNSGKVIGMMSMKF